MKRNRSILCLLLAALLSGCGTPEEPAIVPTPSATCDEAVPDTTQPQVPEQTTLSPTTQPQTEITVPVETPATEATQVPTSVPLLTLPEPTQGITVCGHDYRQSFYQAPTCEQAGVQNYRCEKCADVQQSLFLPLGHSYLDATCTAAQTCERCGSVEGTALGHEYITGSCSRCGEQDPTIRTITIQVKDTKNNSVDGVTVALYLNEQLHSTCVSSNGTVSFTIRNHSGSYRLTLTGIPSGYKAQKTSYTYRSNSGVIVLDIVPVVSPDDHSKAAYKVGSTMGDFTVTDVEGKTFRLSQLLQEKQLVILNFWYYTCVPCKAEFPYFNSVYQKYSDDIEILGLNHFDSEAQIRQLRSEMGLTFPLATEDLGMQQGFGIQSYPVTVFIGSNGRILKIQKDIGFQSEAELETIVRQMISK